MKEIDGSFLLLCSNVIQPSFCVVAACLVILHCEFISDVKIFGYVFFNSFIRNVIYCKMVSGTLRTFKILCAHMPYHYLWKVVFNVIAQKRNYI